MRSLAARAAALAGRALASCRGASPCLGHPAARTAAISLPHRAAAPVQGEDDEDDDEEEDDEDEDGEDDEEDDEAEDESDEEGATKRMPAAADAKEQPQECKQQ